MGKSTMTEKLSANLRAQDFKVREYLEFDAANPIDFYSTAYIDKEEFHKLCAAYPESAECLRRNSVDAGKAILVRYCNGRMPIFSGELQRELEQREFCYKPLKPIPVAEYTESYRKVWQDFARSIGSEYDYILFDGSCLHHSINDLMRNYDAKKEAALKHVKLMLEALEKLQRQIFYLYTSDVTKRLIKARIARGQSAPSDAQMDFWKRRHNIDVYVLGQLAEDICMEDVSDGWNAAEMQIMEKIK